MCICGGAKCQESGVPAPNQHGSRRCARASLPCIRVWGLQAAAGLKPLTLRRAALEKPRRARGGRSTKGTPIPPPCGEVDAQRRVGVDRRERSRRIDLYGTPPPVTLRVPPSPQGGGRGCGLLPHIHREAIAFNHTWLRQRHDYRLKDVWTLKCPVCGLKKVTFHMLFFRFSGNQGSASPKPTPGTPLTIITSS